MFALILREYISDFTVHFRMETVHFRFSCDPLLQDGLQQGPDGDGVHGVPEHVRGEGPTRWDHPRQRGQGGQLSPGFLVQYICAVLLSKPLGSFSTLIGAEFVV